MLSISRTPGFDCFLDVNEPVLPTYLNTTRMELLQHHLGVWRVTLNQQYTDSSETFHKPVFRLTPLNSLNLFAQPSESRGIDFATVAEGHHLESCKFCTNPQHGILGKLTLGRIQLYYLVDVIGIF